MGGMNDERVLNWYGMVHYSYCVIHVHVQRTWADRITKMHGGYRMTRAYSAADLRLHNLGAWRALHDVLPHRHVGQLQPRRTQTLSMDDGL